MKLLIVFKEYKADMSEKAFAKDVDPKIIKFVIKLISQSFKDMNFKE